MNEFALLAVVATLVILVVVTEIVSAALPLIIVITLVPPHERSELAAVLAACDSSHKLRLWTALHAAVKARRLRRRRDRNLNTHTNLETTFDRARDQAPANRHRAGADEVDVVCQVDVVEVRARVWRTSPNRR